MYAKDIDVAVPNIMQGSFQTIKLHIHGLVEGGAGDAGGGDGGSRGGREGSAIVPSMSTTSFKSEASFESAYSGYSTRNIIMEERNIYCGAYNVMVIIDQ